MYLLHQVEGLETIRAFGWCDAATRSNIVAIDNAQRAEFLQLCVQRWLNIVLIDAIDIHTIDVNALRQRAFIVLSQDPLILHNETLRLNLDSDFLASDADIMGALDHN